MTTNNAHFDNDSKTAYTTPAEQEVSGEPAPTRGSVFAIMGTPRGDLDNINNTETILRLREEAERVLVNVEVTHLNNVPLVTHGALTEMVEDIRKDHPGPEVEDLIKGIAFSGALMETAMASMEQYEEAAEARRVSLLTPEEKAQEKAKSTEWVKNLYAEAHAQSEQGRADSLNLFYGTAQKWATLPELSATERCHGVAHDLYLKFGPKTGSDGYGRDVKYNLSDDYAKHYDHNFADDIRRNTIRAAKELFGS